ncbi:glycosyltransferase family 90 protein [Aspergillus melleus]|uniref:glycosyltransferase family 90 protein n=1 Tax=Aspergillus melleus TaxID=138277 RepID=UPI001E8EB8DC|nr:uncharacterized protein LDX57_010033 [Aspergillus melleus]KAH8432394.1 hypothetical protein LDX57_010033 [Aspergillus melleus]
MDDFDTIYQGISPFWRLSGRQVLDVVDQAQRAPGADLWLCVFSGREATTQCSHPFRKSDRDINHLFDSLLHQLPGVLPDVKFLVNHLDEPRVLIPPQPAESESAYHEQSNNRADFFNLSDISGKTTWDTLTEFCSSSSEHTGAYPDAHTETPSILPFISNLSSAIDLCRHPEYRSMHGLAISPTSFLPFQGPVPIFSTGAPSTMADILYPSPAYLQPEFRYNNNSAHDVPWARKRNQLYWMGSTTGGFAGPDTQWQHHHRQRFVQLAQNLDQKDHLYLREIDNHNGEATITSTHSSFLNSRLFDVAFTRITQCSPSSCRAQRQYFTTQSWADKDGALGSRLVFDLDGNGISGRYYKLLASRSTPLKQTIFREWHDDRLVPWVHYIPVSLGMEELPELVSYLTSTTAGQARAQEIAEQGRKWFFQALRDVDMTVYTYRLLLELARIQDPEREAWEIP